MSVKSILRFTSLMGLLCFALRMEAAPRIVTSKEALQFGKTKTYFVMTGDDIVADSYLKEAMTSTWKITPAEIIDLPRFEKLKNDTMCSFVLNNTVIHPKFANQKYIYLNLLLGSPKANSISDLPVIADIPFGCINSDKDPKYYMMPCLLRFLQQHATRIQTRSFWEIFKLNFDKRLSYYNRFNSELKGKTIYIDTTDLARDISTEYILLTFGKKLVRTDEKSLDKLSKQSGDTVLIAYSVPSFNIILSPSEGKMFYFNGKPGKNSDRFNMDDMKTLYFNTRERKNFLTY